MIVASVMERERRDIGARLENWGRWSTFTPGQRVHASQTGAVCEQLRAAVEGDKPNSGERRRVDEGDALLLERNMRHLTTRHRMLLWYCYIRQAQPSEVCRRLSIPHRPASEFVDVFRAAQQEIEKYVDGNNFQE